MGLHEILGRDYATEEPYWGPSSRPVPIMLVKFWNWRCLLEYQIIAKYRQKSQKLLPTFKKLLRKLLDILMLNVT